MRKPAQPAPERLPFDQEAMTSLPNPETAKRLLREAAGPSFWSCRGTISSAHGPLLWEERVSGNVRSIKPEEPPRAIMMPTGRLLDTKGQPRLILPRYTWFRVLDGGKILIWQPSGRGVMTSTHIRVHLLDLDHLRPLENSDSLEEARGSVDPRFLTASRHCSRIDINPDVPPGLHEISWPAAFDQVPEFLVLAENPGLPRRPRDMAICIYAINPMQGTMEIFPQDWFNQAELDYGYQWISAVARDPVSGRLLVGGIRIDSAILDGSGREIAQTLPR